VCVCICALQHTAILCNMHTCRALLHKWPDHLKVIHGSFPEIQGSFVETPGSFVET